jgi:GNAT superfamily N-acetyltransferase
MESSTRIPHFIIKPAQEGDAPLILSFIKQLAEYERLAQEVTATVESLRATLFGARPFAEAAIGYYQNQPVAFALFFHNYSTFLGKPGLYLEDLFVIPEMRGKGLGREMLAYLARLAKERNCGRLEWWVLDWNEPAIDFYKKLGATPMSDWTVFRLAGEALEKLAAGENFP